MKNNKLTLLFYVYFFIYCIIFTLPVVSQNVQSPELSSLLKIDSITRATNDLPKQAEVNEKIATYYFEIDPNKSISYFEKASKIYDQINNSKHLGFCLQNIAFSYDEKLDDFKMAIKYAEKALFVWEKNEDLYQAANMLKYIGLLYSKIEEFVMAETYIQKAIDQYTLLGFDTGLAVCYYNLALVNERMQNLDSSLQYLKKAKDLWKLTNNHSSRIFIVNNALFKIYLTTEDLSKAFEVYLENKPNARSVPWQHELNFYEHSKIYFNKKGDSDSVTLYKSKIAMLKKHLAEEGIYIEK